MSTAISRIRAFQILPQALAFISECLEAGSPAHLFDQTLEAEALTDPQKYAQRAKQFAQGEYFELLREHKRIDLRERYRAASFPGFGHVFTLRADRQANEISQIDFRKRDIGWVIERISLCRE